MSVWQDLVNLWKEFCGEPVLGGLSSEEYAEFETLEECVSWRHLSVDETVRWAELYLKRGIL